ncbi:hypothetical protein IFO70_23630 [Phormidium tenue FACHB-886]|nr:hypothetical protein [Phormidium tenue FACHB-886]
MPQRHFITRRSKMNGSNDRLPRPKYVELPDELAAHLCGGTIPEVHKVPDITLKRGVFSLNYFDSKLLTAVDFKDE